MTGSFFGICSIDFNKDVIPIEFLVVKRIYIVLFKDGFKKLDFLFQLDIRKDVFVHDEFVQLSK